VAGASTLVTILPPALAGFSKASPLNGLKDRRGWGAMKNKRNEKIMWIARTHMVASHPAVDIKSQLTIPAAKAV
jgi:hypothetical protein